MAAVIPTSVLRTSPGEFTLHIYKIPATADDTNTFDTGIQGIVSVMACQSDTAETATSTGFGASFSGTTITLHIGEDNSAGTVWVLSRS